MNASNDETGLKKLSSETASFEEPLELSMECADFAEDSALSPLRAMVDLENVTFEFNEARTIERSSKKKRTSEKRSANRLRERGGNCFKEEELVQFSPFSDFKRDFESEEGAVDANARKPRSVHKKWVDDDKSPIVFVGGTEIKKNGRTGLDYASEENGFRLDFCDRADEEKAKDDEVVAVEEEEEEEEPFSDNPDDKERVDPTEEILRRVRERNLTWHAIKQTPRFYPMIQSTRGIPPTPIGNNAVPWPSEVMNENTESFNTEAFLNSIQTGTAYRDPTFGPSITAAAATTSTTPTPIVNSPPVHHRTPIHFVGGLQKSSFFAAAQRTPAVPYSGNCTNKEPPSSDEKLAIELRRAKEEILNCQDRRKRLRDTLKQLREKEETLYAKAAEMQRELLSRDPSRALELGGTSIFEAIPPLDDMDAVWMAEKTTAALNLENKEGEQRRRVEVEETIVDKENKVKANNVDDDENAAINKNNNNKTENDVEAKHRFTSTVLQTYDVHSSVVHVQFLNADNDPDSWLCGQTSLLAASSDDVIRLFSHESRKPFALIRIPDKGLSCVATTMSDRVAFCATKFGGVSQIDLATGAKIGTVVQNFEQVRVNKPIECMKATSDILVCAGEGSTIRVWDARCSSNGVAPVTFHAPGARSVSSLAINGDLSSSTGQTTLLASAPTAGLFAFDLRMNDTAYWASSSSPTNNNNNSSSSSSGRSSTIYNSSISRLSGPHFETEPMWVNARFCRDEIFAISCDGNAATFEARAPFKATSAFANVCAPFTPSIQTNANVTTIKTGAVLEVSADGEHVLVATGQTGSSFQCFNKATGAVVAAWDPTKNTTTSKQQQFAPITTACWGPTRSIANTNEPFSQDSFVTADATGIIRVFASS